MIVVVAVKRYCIEDAAVNYNYRELLPADTVRTRVFNHIYEAAGYAVIVNDIHTYKRIGKNSKCLDEKLVYLQAVGKLFEIIKSEAVCSTENTFDEIAEKYKLDCIRENLACRYGLGNIVDELIDLLGLNGANNGIGFMTIQGPEDEPDCSPFQPTSPN